MTVDSGRRAFYLVFTLFLGALSACGAAPGFDESPLFSAPPEVLLPGHCGEALRQDAHQAVKNASIGGPAPSLRVLFVPTTEECCVTGGERNFGLLTLAMQKFGFEVTSLIDRGSCAQTYEREGIQIVGRKALGEEEIRSRLNDEVLEQFQAAFDAVGAPEGTPKALAALLDALELKSSSSIASAPVFLDVSLHLERALHVARSYYLVKRAIQKLNPDVIVTDIAWDATAAILAAHDRRIRVVSYVQSADPDISDPFVQRYAEIVACSEKSAERFSEEAVLTVIKNGVNTDRFSPETEKEVSLRGLMGVGPQAFVIGQAGYIDGNKNQLAVLRAAIVAAETVPDLHVAFLGIAPQPYYLAGLERIAKRAGIEDKIHYLGHRNDIPSLLLEMDLFAFPSRQEAFGLALAEALSSGVPAIAKPLPAYEDFRCAALTLLDVEDAGLFAQAMVSVAQEGDARKSRGLLGRQQIVSANLTTDRMLASFAHALEHPPTQASLLFPK